MFPQLLPAQYDSVNVQGKPEIYCGLLTLVLLPLFYMMPHLYTADLSKAVFMAEPAADVLAVAFTGVLFFFEFRKALRAMPKSEKKS